MNIREIERCDYEQVIGLMSQLNPSDPPASEIEFCVFNEIIESKNFRILVADDEGLLLGSCYLNIIPNITRGGKPYAVIENVVTDNVYRSQGIGKSLLDRAVELAWAENCYKVMLMTGRKESAVHEFYKKCGFSGNQKQAYIQRPPL